MNNYKGSITSTKELKDTLNRLKDVGLDIENDYFDIYVMNFRRRYILDVILLEDALMKENKKRFREYYLKDYEGSLESLIIKLYGDNIANDVKNLIGLQWSYES